MIGRRAFASAMAATLVGAYGSARAQAPTKIPRVGWLSGSGALVGYPPFLEGLREHGYVPEQNVLVDRRIPEPGQFEQVPALAARLIAGRPDVTLAANPHSLDALFKATRAIPTVGIDLESDPVARGWVASLARPGGNVTGFFLDIPEISGKQLQFLREVKVDLRRIAVLGDPRVNDLQFRASEAAARGAGLTLQALSVTSLDGIAGAIADAARQRAGALLALTSPLISAGLPHIAEGALRHRLPAICPFVPMFAEAGGLIAYGPDFPDLFRRGGDYVARILKGAKVRDLPVQRPAKFVLAVNLKTARALGLTLPLTLVQRADDVIE